MLVPRPIVGKILRGEATLAVRPASTRRPRLGERLYVKAQQRDEIACHVLVTEVEDRPLGAVTFEQARACGYRTTADLKAWWVQEHDLAWLNRQMEDERPFPDDEEFAARFDRRWAPKLAHVIRFELDHSERPRLLAHRNAKANYVEHPAQAMPREPEAVPAATQKLYSREKSQGFAARELQRQVDRERLGLTERLSLALSEGRDARVEESIRKRIRALESRNRRRT